MKRPKNKFFNGDVVEVINASDYQLQYEYKIKGYPNPIGLRFKLRTYKIKTSESVEFVYWLQNVDYINSARNDILVKEHNITLYKRTIINRIRALFT